MYSGKLFGKCKCTLNSGVVKEGVHESTLHGVLFSCRHHEDARTQQSETQSLQSRRRGYTKERSRTWRTPPSSGTCVRASPACDVALPGQQRGRARIRTSDKNERCRHIVSPTCRATITEVSCRNIFLNDLTTDNSLDRGRHRLANHCLANIPKHRVVTGTRNLKFKTRIYEN